MSTQALNPQPLNPRRPSTLAAAAWIALIAWGATFVLPPNGIGVSLCLFRNLTGLPCPGCGLTRSVLHLSHLDVSGALAHHPFGIFAYLIMIALASTLWSPWRHWLLARIDRHRAAVAWLATTLAIALALFGAWRLSQAALLSS